MLARMLWAFLFNCAVEDRSLSDMKAGLRLIVMLLLAHAGLVTSAPAGEPLVDVAKIRSLSREEAAQALPVKLTGVVIYRGWNDLVLHDGKESIYLDFRFSQAKGVWKGNIPNMNGFGPGTGLVVEGVTDPGGFSPMVMVSKLEPVGPKPVPPPLRPTTEELLSSSHDSRWVEVEGVVRKFEALPHTVSSLKMIVGGHPCQVILPNGLGLAAEQLVDAKVRVRGVLLNISNLRSQTTGMKLHSNGVGDIDILTPPPADPFSAPRIPLDRLISYQPDAALGHRTVSSGLVTFALPGKFFYIMEKESCVRVHSASARVAPGDIVEVAGFIDTSRALASFSEALVRKIGTGTVPTPAEPSVFDILNPRTRSAEEMVTEPGHPDFDSRLIRLNGALRRVLPPDKDGNATLVVEVDSHLVYALLPGAAPAWKEGSTVELTGVCELEIARIDRMPWFTIEDFHVWLSSPADLRVIAEPSWWTQRRLGILLASLLLVLVVALAWGYAMRRQVAIRGAQLAAEITARESAQIEHATTLRERQRLAHDLHDTLEQALMGLALQLEIASRSRTADPERSAHHLSLARQFLERSRSEVHRTVWDLRAHGQDGRDFLDILKERVSSMVAGSGVTISLRREDDARPMPDLVAGNLLLLAQEAVTNALKHSGASEIGIILRMPPGCVELVIEDNGRGFDSALAPGQQEGHFGLQGMRERTKRLDGKIEWITSPGHGTSLRVWVPLPYTESEEPTPNAGWKDA